MNKNVDILGNDLFFFFYVIYIIRVIIMQIDRYERKSPTLL